MKLTAQQAIPQAYKLYDVWIGPLRHGDSPCTPEALERIRQSAIAELRYARTKPERAGVVREIRGELVLLGKVRKALVS